MPLYILMPSRGFASESFVAKSSGKKSSSGSAFALSALSDAEDVQNHLEMVEEIVPRGPKLVSLEAAAAKHIRQTVPSVRISPIRRYKQSVGPRAQASPKLLGTSGAATWQRATIRVIDRETRQPVSGVDIRVLSNRETGAGISRKTGADGRATLTMPRLSRVDELLFYPPASYWGRQLSNVAIADAQEFELTPLEGSPHNLLTSSMPRTRKSDGAGVKVAVIDSGVDATHPDLEGQVLHHEVCVIDEPEPAPPRVFVGGHGTHVAGIIAGARFGLAPGAKIYDFRVFADGRRTTSNANILKAIERAVELECDIINLSLGGGALDPPLNEAMGYALERGTVCIAAAGNRTRSHVDYPASFKRAMAVSAFGYRSALPAEAVELFDRRATYSANDADIFVAGFSNIGPEIDFTGPGVGVVSTWPGGLYRAESGTSMATPAVSGIAARLLSRPKQASLLSAPRDLKRASAIVNLLREQAASLGFPKQYEGYGKPEA